MSGNITVIEDSKNGRRLGGGTLELRGLPWLPRLTVAVRREWMTVGGSLTDGTRHT